MTASDIDEIRAVVASAAARVQFDEPTHVYRVAGKPELISVTGVLKAFTTTDPTNKTLWYSPFADVKPDVLEHKRQIGSAVHLATHYADRGVLDESTVAEDVRPYLAAWEAFHVSRRPFVLATEIRLAHGLHPLAGTLDKLLWLPGFDDANSVTVCDLKCGDPKSARTHLQTAAYAELLRSALTAASLRPLRINRMSVRLMDDGTYRAQPYTSRLDWPKFNTLCNAITVIHEENHAPIRSAVA